MCVCFPGAFQCLIPSHHRWFSLPASSQRIPGWFMDRQRSRETVCLCVKPGVFLTGELMKTSVLDFRTNLYLTNVSRGEWTSNTRCLLLLLFPPDQQKVILHGCCYVFRWLHTPFTCPCFAQICFSLCLDEESFYREASRICSTVSLEDVGLQTSTWRDLAGTFVSGVTRRTGQFISLNNV